MRKFLIVAAFLAVAALVVSPAMAQRTTGQITGEAIDDEGNGVAGATVTATSPALQGERTVTTDNEGNFVLAVLPTGIYKLKFNKAGHQGFILSDVLVLLGQVSPVRVTLKTGEITETITVTSTFPLIETKSADTAVNLSAKMLDTIPTAARSFRDLAKFVPSITSVDLNTTNARGPGYPSIRGEGQYGDNYLIDGLTVRDPATKTPGTPMSFEAMEEVQIITDGFSPEYGQALGGSINVITKSGSNQIGGEVAYLYRSDSTSARFLPTFLNTPAEFDRTQPFANIGGPLIKDKLWYFASWNRSEVTDTFAPTPIAGFGILPAGVDDTGEDSYFGKLTYAINSRHNISGNYTWRDRARTGGGSFNSTPEARTASDIEDSRIRLNYQAVFTANSVLELKYGTVDRESSALPESGERGPAQYRLSSYGVNTNNAWRLSSSERKRNDWAAIYTQFWNPGGWLGSHEFKIGYEVHEPEQLSGSTFTGTAEDVFDIDTNPDSPTFGGADTFDQGSLYLYRAATVLNQVYQIPTTLNEYRSSDILGNSSEESGIYLQDRWEIGNWNFMAGFRMDEQTGYNDANDVFFEYDLEKSWSPRVSVNWDATGDGKNIFKSGWGRLYDVASTRFGEFANTREAFAFRTYTWMGGMDANSDGSIDDLDWAGIDFLDEIDTGNPFDIHEASNWDFAHEQSASSNPLDYSPVTRPAHSDRFLLEYDRQIANDYALKVRYVNAKSRGLIEDIHFFYNDWQVVNTDLKRRDYNSFELEFNGRPTPNIRFNASYVHSTAKGTSPGQFETAGFLGTSGSGNNIGVFLDRPPSNPEGWIDYYGTPEGVSASWLVDDPLTPEFEPAFNDYNNDNMVNYLDRDLFIQTYFAGLGAVDGDDDWYGLLPYSIDDQVKLYGHFNIPKWGDTYVTVFYNWNSGYHTQRRGFQHLYGDYLTFSDNDWFGGYEGACTSFADCETLYAQTSIDGQDFNEEQGTARGGDINSSFWTFDLSIGKQFNLGGRVGLELRGEFFNILNNQVALSINDRATGSFGEPLTRQFPRSARAFVRISF